MKRWFTYVIVSAICTTIGFAFILGLDFIVRIKPLEREIKNAPNYKTVVKVPTLETPTEILSAELYQSKADGEEYYIVEWIKRAEFQSQDDKTGVMFLRKHDVFIKEYIEGNPYIAPSAFCIVSDVKGNVNGTAKTVTFRIGNDWSERKYNIDKDFKGVKLIHRGVVEHDDFYDYIPYDKLTKEQKNEVKNLFQGYDGENNILLCKNYNPILSKIPDMKGRYIMSVPEGFIKNLITEN